MKLTDLDASFITGVTKDGSFRVIDGLATAQGVMFQCPRCAEGKLVKEENGQRFVEGAHYIVCWFSDRGVPDEAAPRPGRWTPAGTSLADLTLSPSVQLLGGGCQWHGFVRDGQTVDA